MHGLLIQISATVVSAISRPAIAGLCHQAREQAFNSCVDEVIAETHEISIKTGDRGSN